MRTLKYTKITEPKLIEIVVSNIKWDKEGKKVKLPKEVIFEMDLDTLEMYHNLRTFRFNEDNGILKSIVSIQLRGDYKFNNDGFSFEVRNPNNYTILK
jgi:hypothetical protein